MKKRRNSEEDYLLALLKDEGESLFRAPESLTFAKQKEVAADTAKSKALLCGRRAGKTFGWIYEFAKDMLEYKNSSFVFVEKTGKAAKNKLWRPFKRRNDEHNWGFHFRDQDREVHSPTGSVLYLAGADRQDELDKVRGLERVRKAVIDECGTQKPMNLEYMAEQVLEPGLMDTGGTLCLSGTPGLALIGYWYDVTAGARPGWTIHRWDARDNPHINAQEYFAEIKRRRGWDDDNPVFRREYLGQWVRESERLVYAFDRQRNLIPSLPAERPGWQYVLAMDFGVVHSTAWVVLGYPPHGHRVYVCQSFKRSGLAPSEAADITQDLITTWHPDRVVGDLGGLGKAFAQETVKRHGIAIQPAQKAQKRAALEYTSDALRTGNLVAVESECQGLIREWETVLWDELHEDIAEGQDDHESEAAVYGYRECPAYAQAAEPPDPKLEKLPPWARDPEDDEDWEEPQAPFWEFEEV